jgi:hypothetical protein
MRSLLASLRRAAGSISWLARAMRFTCLVLRQWPWIFPAGVIVSAAKWIDEEHDRGGWYARQRGDWYRILYPSSLRACAPPLSGTAQDRFRDEQFYRVPEAGVFCFRGAYLLSDEGAVLSRDNRLFDEFVHHFRVAALDEGRYFKAFAGFSLDIARRAEWIALLASPECRNHYHWLFDVLPRLHLLAESRGQVELFAVPAGLTPVQTETLGLLGIGKEALLELAPDRKIYCERLLVPSLPGSEGAVPEWAVKFLREQFLGARAAPAKRRNLYLSRAGARERRLVNESEISALLAERGFEIVQAAQLSFAEQVSLFRDAAAVVGCHGAGFANVVFADECQVLELFSPEYFRPDCFFTLSAQLGHRYQYLVGQASASGWGDISVNRQALAAALDGWA